MHLLSWLFRLATEANHPIFLIFYVEIAMMSLAPRLGMSVATPANAARMENRARPAWCR